MASSTSVYTNFTGVGASLNVHKDHAGMVIGPKFANVNWIEKNTHSRIIVHASENDFVRFEICARSRNDCVAAYYQLVSSANQAETNSNMKRSHLIPRQELVLNDIFGTEARCVVNADDVGFVLGRHGKTLRGITNDTRTWSKFFNSDTQSGGMPAFSIRGFVEADVKEAEKRVMSIAQESASRRSRPNSLDDVNLGELVGDNIENANVCMSQRQKRRNHVVSTPQSSRPVRSMSSELRALRKSNNT